MADTVNTLQEQLEKIDQAITKLQIGERISSVSYDNHSVSYASITLEELLAQRQRLLAKLAQNNRKQVIFATHKGVRP